MRFLLCLPLVIISNAVLAATPTAIGADTPDPLSTANLTQWTIGLIFVLLMILIVAWAAKRFTGLGSAHKGDLKILSGISLGSREKAVLIKAGNQHLLLGVSPGRVVNLHTFEEGEISGDVNQEQPESNAFQDSLQKFMNKRREA